jgi:hypothetical protein
MSSYAELNDSRTDIDTNEVTNPLQEGNENIAKVSDSKGATKSIRRSQEINELSEAVSEDEGYDKDNDEFDSYSLLEEVCQFFLQILLV